MNYYPFHIGDFRSGTVNMSRLSRWIYRDMLDVYYDAEKPLPLDFDLLCDGIGADTEEERRIVERLLRFKFEKTEDGYRHEICERVISEYHAKAETARANGRLGGRPRKESATDKKPTGFQSGFDQDAISNPVETGSQTNQEPRTKNHKEELIPPAITSIVVGAKTDKSAGAVTAAQLSAAFRLSGISTQPADPRLIALAEQGVAVETVEAACDEARKSKPGEAIGLGYVARILERWAKDAAELKAEGVKAPKRDGAWWATDATILAKGEELGMRPLPGEAMPQFKGRIQSAIDNAGKPPAPRSPPPSKAISNEPERAELSAEEKSKRSESLRAALKPSAP